MNSNKRQNGFTIIELLISMVISLTLIFASLSIYSSLKGSIVVAQDLASAQDSLRTAHYLMSRAIRQGNELTVSGSGSTQSLIVTYGEQATDHDFRGCLGEESYDGGTDQFYVNTIDSVYYLYCKSEFLDSSSGVEAVSDQAIALNVTYLSASLATSPRKGAHILLKIDGMPGTTTGTLGYDGILFSVAMHQRIIIDSAISGASATALSSATSTSG